MASPPPAGSASKCMLVKLIVLFVTQWPACSAGNVKSYFERLPIPPGNHAAHAEGETTAPPYSMAESRLSNVCHDLSYYAQLYNDDSLTDSQLRQASVLKLLDIQNCPLGFPHGFTAIHTIHSHSDVAELDAVCCAGKHVDRSLAKSRRRTVKVYRLRFPKRVTNYSLEFSQSRIVVPMEIRFGKNCSMLKYRLTLLDGEKAISKFAPNPCDYDQSSGNLTINAVLNSTKLLRNHFQKQQGSAVPLEDRDHFTKVFVKLVYFGGMSAEVSHFTRSTLVLLQANATVSCEDPVHAETPSQASAASHEPAGESFRSRCQALCHYSDHSINLNVPIRTIFPFLRLHASMLSVNVGLCEGNCVARSMRACGFRHATYHGLVMDTLSNVQPAQYSHLPSMSCAVNTNNLKSLWVPYAYDTPGTGWYTDCGITIIHKATVAQQGGCHCF